MKNSAVAAGTALALFEERASMPAVVIGVFTVVYIVWLSLRAERSQV